MNKKFKFIELPKNEVDLSKEELSYLLGGGNCITYTSCPEEYNNTCKYDNGNCSNTGACGGTFYCASHTCNGHIFS